MPTRRRFLMWLGSVAAAASRALPAPAATRSRDLICRDAWGARRWRSGLRKHSIRRLTVHHSAVALTDNRQAPGRFRSHQLAHQDRGWPDIAYHYLIDRHGHIYKGRPHWAVGDTATDYDPRGHLLVMCEGNFAEQRPSRAQVAALVDVLAWACRRFDVPARTIRGHGHYAHTACPGTGLNRLLRGTVQDRVRERLAAGGVRLERLCGRAGDRRVAKIGSGEL
jgi:hypothetical protein